VNRVSHFSRVLGARSGTFLVEGMTALQFIARLINYAPMSTSFRPPLPRFFLWLLPLSFALQVAAIGAFHEYRPRSGDDNFEFGWEMGRVGRSIALGQGFASPYEGNTGPTAWEPPLYPYWIGGVFKVFGIYTPASAWVLLSINSLFA